MPASKFFITLFLGLAIVFAQVGIVYAAPPWQDGVSITGAVQNVVVETSSESGLPIVDASVLWTDAGINRDSILSNELPAPAKEQHSIGSKIGEFFDVDYELVMSSRSNGFGFGVIAQSMWMTEKMGGDASLFEMILEAKKSNDYAEVALPEVPVPQNWGQLKKAVLHDNKENPGDVISNGKGNDDQTDQGMETNKDNNRGSKNNKPTTPPGQSKEKNNNGNSDHPVATPPGQNKDKDTDNNGNSENSPGQNKDKDNNGKSKTK